MRKLLFLLAFLPVFAYGQATKTSATFDHVRARASLRIGSGSSTAATGIANVMPATPGTQLITAAGVYNWFTGTITFAGDVAGPYNNLQIGTGAVGANELASTTVTAGTYGSASLVPVVTVDADGRVTGVTTAAVSGGGGGAGIDTLPTYASMRSYTGAANAIFMQGNAGVEPGLFRRVASGTENGGTLIVAANGVKWQRDFDRVTFFPEFWPVGGYDENGVLGGITDVTEAIQAAINVASPLGGTVVLRKQFSPYNVVPKGGHISVGGAKHCVELKSNLIFVISEGAVIQKANGAQTNATNGVSILYADTVSNLEIKGGGSILGNTANQTGWTGGYGQAGVQGCGIFIAQSYSATPVYTNSNVTIRDLIINDHFSTPAEIQGVSNLLIDNVYFQAVGEGLEMANCEDVNVTNLTGVGTGVEEGDGFETSGVNYFNFNNIYIKNWSGGGTCIDIYASKQGNLSNFIIDGPRTSGGGISVGTTGGGAYSDRINISDGLIRGQSTGIYPPDGGFKVSNVTFDSCLIGIQVTAGVYAPAASLKNESVISNCTFKNTPQSDGAGLLIIANRLVHISGCVFENMWQGIAVLGSASTLTPRVEINACVFNQIATNALNFNAQSQAGFTPQATINGCTFRNVTSRAILIPTNSDKIKVENSLIDSIYVYGSGTAEVIANTMYLIDASPNTISTIPVAADGHEVTFIANLSGGQTKSFTSAGNLLLEGAATFGMVTNGTITFRYTTVLDKWVELSRASQAFIPTVSGANGQVGVFNASNNLTGYNRLFYNAAATKLGVGTNLPPTTLSLAYNGGSSELDRGLSLQDSSSATRPIWRMFPGFPGYFDGYLNISRNGTLVQAFEDDGDADYFQNLQVNENKKIGTIQHPNSYLRFVNTPPYRYAELVGWNDLGLRTLLGQGDIWLRESGLLGIGTYLATAKVHIYAASNDTTKMLRLENTTGSSVLYRSNATPVGVITANAGDVALTPSGLFVKGSAAWGKAITGTAYTPTSSADVTGDNGDIAYDANYIYMKVAGSWKRSALSTF